MTLNRTPRPTLHAAVSALTALTALIALAGCASADAPGATVDLKPTQGQTATGQLTMRQAGDRVQVTARVTGLKPNQQHGMHVHDKGDCSAPDASSAGAHFNPTAMAHGMPEAGVPHHGGDLPALQADATGRAEATFEVPGSAASFVGKAVIVHADPDDYKTQPTGNSGARIACGLVVGKG